MVLRQLSGETGGSIGRAVHFPPAVTGDRYGREARLDTRVSAGKRPELVACCPQSGRAGSAGARTSADCSPAGWRGCGHVHRD